MRFSVLFLFPVFLLVYEWLSGYPRGQVRAKLAQLSIANGEPVFTLRPKDRLFREGTVAKLHCEAVGRPRPEIAWYFDNSPLRTTRRLSLKNTNSLLTIYPFLEQDVGRYKCIVSNILGRIEASAKIRLLESIPPRITFAPNDRTVRPGAEVHFECRAVGEPVPHINWYFNGSPIPTLRGHYQVSDDQTTLTIRHATKLDQGTFGCEAENVVGATVATARLIVHNIHQQQVDERVTPELIRQSVQEATRNVDRAFNETRRQLLSRGGKKSPSELLALFRFPGPQAVELARAREIYEQTLNLIKEHVERGLYLGMEMDEKVSYESVLAVSHLQLIMELSGCTPGQFKDPCSDMCLHSKYRRNLLHPCIEFERSSAVCGSGETSVIFRRISVRQQLNTVTSYVDGSQIYGSNEQEALDLRDLYTDHGLLRFDIVSHRQKPYLPFNKDAQVDCQRNHLEVHPIRCFLAGDYRANEQLGLLSMQTLWLREHNRLAASLLALNPHWHGERIYQETRKLIGAKLQHITYSHWLPKILGPVGMHLLNDYRGYNQSIDPSISNEFATAAFRFGHGLVNPVLFRFDRRFQPTDNGHLPLHEAFFAPERLLSEGGVDPILRGLFAGPMKQLRSDQLLNQELTERLFEKSHNVALDLAALNIQRGRDHGLPGYFELRNWCNLTVPDSWDEMIEVIPDNLVRTKLRQLYGHPGNIDLWIGGISETPLLDAVIGPTFACIIADQFRRLRDGDRFWYENEGVFTALQLSELRKVSLSRVVCENGDDIDRISKDVFLYRNHSQFASFYQSCLEIPKINLNVWQECCDDICRSSSESIYDEQTNEAFRRKRSHNYEKSRLDELEKKLGKIQTEIAQIRENNLNRCAIKEEIKDNGSRWKIDDCTWCRCQNGTVWCTTESCSPTNCENPLRLSSVCCPICI